MKREKHIFSYQNIHHIIFDLFSKSQKIDSTNYYLYASSLETSNFYQLLRSSALITFSNIVNPNLKIIGQVNQSGIENRVVNCW